MVWAVDLEDTPKLAKVKVLQLKQWSALGNPGRLLLR